MITCVWIGISLIIGAVLRYCSERWPGKTIFAVVIVAIGITTYARINDPEHFFLPKKSPAQCKADADRVVKELHDFFKPAK